MGVLAAALALAGCTSPANGPVHVLLVTGTIAGQGPPGTEDDRREAPHYDPGPPGGLLSIENRTAWLWPWEGQEVPPDLEPRLLVVQGQRQVRIDHWTTPNCCNYRDVDVWGTTAGTLEVPIGPAAPIRLPFVAQANALLLDGREVQGRVTVPVDTTWTDRDGTPWRFVGNLTFEHQLWPRAQIHVGVEGGDMEGAYVNLLPRPEPAQA